ncbi:MAG: heme b synthase [Gemmatimonadales bacterium]|nr:MAG: heme b synthase [Gemmatimonadales bacterium]
MTSVGALERFSLTPRPAAEGVYLPHVVAWNLTRRCNLECAHCYISAGPESGGEGELDTAEVLRIMEEILEVNPAPMFILSGGEPLLRSDLAEIARFASAKGATVVVGTNGTLLDGTRLSELKAAGVSGFAISVDSLKARYHDNFRRGHGALSATLSAVELLRRHRIDFVVQTTLTKANRDELEDLVAWSADQGAVAFNAYFLVSTGRGRGLKDLSPEDYEELLSRLVDLQVRYLGRLMVRAKCAPHFMRLVHQRAPDSPVLNYETRCPCGIQYCRVTPDGRLTPCPYLPLSAGDLRREPFARVWNESPLFGALREGRLGGRCGICEYRKICGGCRARAFALEGDPLAEDPSCAYRPDGSRPVIQRARAVTYGMQVERKLVWTEEAEARLARIPSFVRGVVIQRLEDYARSRGIDRITPELMREVREKMPVDFSKKLPFFARDDD